jgi:lipopolysaccharide export system permease protein
VNHVLGRYVIRQMLLGTLAALLLLSTLDFVFALIAELGSVGRGQYGVSEAVAFTLLTLPRRMYELMPLAALLGSLLWLGNLANHSELTAMRAAGVSIRQVIFWVMQGGLFVVIIMLVTGEFLASRAEARANDLKIHATEERITTGPLGIWARDGQRIIRAQTLLPGQHLRDVRIFHLDSERRLLEITAARSAQHHPDGWQLEGVARTYLAPTATRIEHHESERQQRLLASEYLEVLVIEPRQMAALDLLRYIRYLRANNLSTSVYEVALWQRLTLPASTWVVLLLAMPFLFTHQRERGAGLRLFLGLLLGVGYTIVMRMMTHLGLVYDLPPWLAASAPMWIFLLLALLLMRRIRT